MGTSQKTNGGNNIIRTRKTVYGTTYHTEDKMPKEMRYAIIKFDGKAIGRAEKVYFPNVRKSTKNVECHGEIIFEEDD